MLNIVIPIAGKAQRFVDAGFTAPKPLIMIQDTHMM
jgi:CTP:phosphocholine cytidylyltransferase-like protein